MKAMSAKEHKGEIADWCFRPSLGGLGYYVEGVARGHPEYDGQRIHTSFVVKHKEKSGEIEIETRNSRYTLRY